MNLFAIEIFKEVVYLKKLRVCTKTLIWTLNHLIPIISPLYGENSGMFSSKFLFD